MVRIQRFLLILGVMAMMLMFNTTAFGQSCPIPTSIGVEICTPTMEETVTSPVLITASAKGNAQIRAWIVYVDGVGVWSPDLFSRASVRNWR
jgi:hypothetical protein